MRSSDSNGRRFGAFSKPAVWDVFAEINDSIDQAREANAGKSFFEENKKEADNSTRTTLIRSGGTESQKRAKSDRGTRAVFRYLLKPFRNLAHRCLSTSVASADRISDHYSIYFW